jgi:hypothetical protein
LVAERIPPQRPWRILDFFPLTDPNDTDLLAIVGELQIRGYGNPPVRANLSPAQFSPLGLHDREAIEAMRRLGRHGHPTSKEVTAIRDRKFLRWIDGEDGRSRRRRW